MRTASLTGLIVLEGSQRASERRGDEVRLVVRSSEQVLGTEEEVEAEKGQGWASPDH